MIQPTPRTLILSRTAVIATLAIAFALVLGTALVSTFAAREVARTDERGENAKQAVSATTQLLATLAAAEASLAALDTGTTDDRTEFSNAQQKLRQEVVALPAKLSERPDLLPYLDLLDSLSLDIAGTAAELVDHPDAAHSAAMLTRFAEMRRLLFTLHRQEFAFLVDLSHAAASRARAVQSLNGGLVALALALGATSAWLLYRRRREVEGMITVCAWTRRVHWKGRWVSFEDYLAQRFNLRCTHGICDEAAEKMRAEVLQSRVPADLRRG